MSLLFAVAHAINTDSTGRHPAHRASRRPALDRLVPNPRALASLGNPLRLERKPRPHLRSSRQRRNGSASVVLSNAHGPLWLTGGDYGPEAALFTGFASIAGIVVLIRVTRDYAWNYTHAPVIPGGYPMDVAPPPAHAAIEQQAAARPPPSSRSFPPLRTAAQSTKNPSPNRLP